MSTSEFCAAPNAASPTALEGLWRISVFSGAAVRAGKGHPSPAVSFHPIFVVIRILTMLRPVELLGILLKLPSHSIDYVLQVLDCKGFRLGAWGKSSGEGSTSLMGFKQSCRVGYKQCVMSFSKWCFLFPKNSVEPLKQTFEKSLAVFLSFEVMVFCPSTLDSIVEHLGFHLA